MKVAVKKGRSVNVVDRELSEVGPGEIKIKILACGICGTDLLENSNQPEQESEFGHEMVGKILEIGECVSGLTLGDQVVIESSSACGRCENCRNAQQELCTDVRSFFMKGTFGFAEEAIVPAISAIPFEDLSPEVACLSEPLGVAIDMVRLADIKLGSNVLIMGPGPIGLMAVALAKRSGASKIFVSGTSRRPVRAEIARQFGADAVIYVDKENLRDYNFNCKIDRILHTTAPDTLEDAFAIATKGAIISFIGIAYGERGFCKVDVNDFHFKKLQLRASFASPALFTPCALEYLRQGVVDGEALISHRFTLEDIEEGMNIARSDPSALKVIITGA